MLETREQAESNLTYCPFPDSCQEPEEKVCTSAKGSPMEPSLVQETASGSKGRPHLSLLINTL